MPIVDRARVADPDNPAIIDSHGWVLYRLGRNEEAVAELRRAFAMQKDAEIGAHLAEVLWVTGHRDERSEEHTSELQSLMRISYAVFCFKQTNFSSYLSLFSFL